MFRAAKRQLCVAGACLALLCACADEPATDSNKLAEAGRLIYEEGVLPDGSLLVATRPEGLFLEGRFAACSTCHRRSGMGSIEGLVERAILVPPVAGPVLFSDARFANSWLDEEHHYVPNATWRRAMKRPAYDQASLDVALREGFNTAGEELLAPMPRYDLDEQALAALTSYLRQLNASPSAGVEADTIHVATIISPEATEEDAAAVVDVVSSWTDSALGAGIPYTHHVWTLEGDPGSWLSQLERAYTHQPVFAVVSGAGRSTWEPVHEFCESHELPCLLPSVETAPATEKEQYSVYYSGGVTTEAGILAKHLRASADESVNPTVIQICGDESGRHATEALASALPGGWQSQTLSVTQAAGLEVPENAVIMLWLRTDELLALAASAPDGLNADTIYVSAMLATPDRLDLPPTWKSQVHFVSMFDDLSIQSEIARLRLERWLKLNGLSTTSDRRVQADAYVAAYLFNKALARTRQQEVRRPPVPFTREHLLETFEDLADKYSDGTTIIDPDNHIAWYGRMSLGPGQRIAVRGGTILRYQSPQSERLVAASERIVP